MIKNNFWVGRKVLVTGHTGFKGSWLSLALKFLGAEVLGVSNGIPTSPSMFEICNVKKYLKKDLRIDIRNYDDLSSCVEEFQPEIVFHLAAQSLVQVSYLDPFSTYSTNVLGTLNLLMSCAKTKSVKSIVNVTTDKCYENKSIDRGYSEEDRLGGYDPYSSSKACVEIMSSSIDRSFFSHQEKYMVTARAGNVIGGGDWAANRIIPDFFRAFATNTKLEIRSPNAVRPWQHVLEPINVYLRLAELNFSSGKYLGAWNIGPEDEDCRSVDFVVKNLLSLIPNHKGIELSRNNFPHEASLLKLDCKKLKQNLGWSPKTNLEDAILMTSDWYKAYFFQDDMESFTLNQIQKFFYE